MNLDEAIEYYSKKGKEQWKFIPCAGCPFDDCKDFNRQLAEWLRELKAYRESWEYLFATIYEIKSNAENEDIKNITNFLLKYMKIYEKEIGEVKADGNNGESDNI